MAQANRTKVDININFLAIDVDDVVAGKVEPNRSQRQVQMGEKKTNRQINRETKSTESMTQCCNKTGGNQHKGAARCRRLSVVAYLGKV